MGEKFFYVRLYRQILHQFFAEQFRDEFARDVIGGRAEAAGGNDEIRATEGFAHGVLDFATGVGDGHLPRDDVAEVGESAAKPLLMRIEDAA